MFKKSQGKGKHAMQNIELPLFKIIIITVRHDSSF